MTTISFQEFADIILKTNYKVYLDGEGVESVEAEDETILIFNLDDEDEETVCFHKQDNENISMTNNAISLRDEDGFIRGIRIVQQIKIDPHYMFNIGKPDEEIVL